MEISDYFRIFRTKDWLHYLGFPILGMVFGGFSNAIYFILPLTGFSLAYAYSLNVVYDKNLKSKVYFIPFLLSLLIIPFLNLIQIFFTITFIFIVTLYSYPIPRLKSKPIICTLCNAIAFPCLFAFGYFENSNFNTGFVYLFSILFFLSSSIQLIHELSDLRDDKREGITTSAVKYGEKISMIFVWISLISTMILSYFLINEFPSFFLFIIFSAFFSIRILNKNWKRIRMEFRYSGLAIGLVITIIQMLY